MEKSIELEALRSQMALLKKEIESQQHVNERMIRAITNDKMRNISRENVLAMAVSVIMLPFVFYWLLTQTTLSLAFIIATSLLILIGLVTFMYISRCLTEASMADAELVVTARKIQKLRHLQILQTRYGHPVIILWLFWFIAEKFVSSSQTSAFASEHLNFFFFLGLALAAIGVCMGIVASRRRTRELKEMERQIEDFTAEQTV